MSHTPTGREDTKSRGWKKGVRSRNAEFTWFLPEEWKTVEELTELYEFLLDDDRITYFVYQREKCPTTGRLHMQGYMEFSTTMTLKACKDIHPTAHWTPVSDLARTRRAEYCKKERTRDVDRMLNGVEVPAGPWSWGKPKAQGSRSDIAEIAEMVQSGLSIQQIASELPAAYIRYHRGIKELRAALIGEAPARRPLELIIIWGAASTGKSTLAREIDNNLYTVASRDGRWFDGYNGHRTILIEDFRCEWSLGHLTTCCDVFPLSVPTKGGFVNARWERVIITSNTHPKKWYQAEESEYRKAFFSRINAIQHAKKVFGVSGNEPLPDDMPWRATRGTQARRQDVIDPPKAEEEKKSLPSFTQDKGSTPSASSLEKFDELRQQGLNQLEATNSSQSAIEEIYDDFS